MNIDIKLKTYEQLQFEITKLNTDIFLKNKKIERLNNIINELEESIKRSYYKYTGEQINALQDVLDKLKKIKGE